MKISPQHNRWLFGVLLEQVREAEIIRFDDLNFKFRPKAISKESLRQLFKMCDLNYPKDEKGLGVSYTKIEPSEMNRHINWIIDTVSQTHSIRFIEAEWDNLMYQCGITK